MVADRMLLISNNDEKDISDNIHLCCVYFMLFTKKHKRDIHK